MPLPDSLTATQHRVESRPMTTLRATLGLVLAFLLVALAPPAGADPTSEAGQWTPQKHVVIAAGANPTLKNPAGLNQRITQTGLPLYVAIDNSATPAQLGKAFSQHLGHEFRGVIVVAGSQGVHAAGVDTPGGNQASTIAQTVSQKHGQNLDAALNDYVTQFDQAATAAAQPAGTQHTTTGAPAQSSGPSFLEWLLIVVLIVAVIAVVVVLIARRRRRKAEQAAAKAQAQSAAEKKLIRASAKVNDLSDWMNTSSVDVHTEYNNASVALSDAQSERNKGNYSAVDAHLETVDTAYKRAEAKVNPPHPYTPTQGEARAKSVPQEQRKQATINATAPNGQTVVINNNDYRTSAGGGYGSYWNGGMYNGAYFAPGYWQYPFWGGGYSWSLTDMVVADILVDDLYGGRYDYAPGYGNYDDQGQFTSSNDYVDPGTQDTNWQGDTSSDNGWQDTGTSSDDGTSSDGGWQDDGTSSDGGWDNNAGADDSQIQTAPDASPSYQDDSNSGGGWSGGGDDNSYSQPDYSQPDTSSSGGGWDGGGSSDFGASDSGGGW